MPNMTVAALWRKKHAAGCEQLVDRRGASSGAIQQVQHASTSAGNADHRRDQEWHV
jgi:hypothetical protein